MTFGPVAPKWDEILEVEGPDCAHIIPVMEWDCKNPERNGEISLMYRITLQVYFDPGCTEDLCVRESKNPKGEEICFSYENFGIEALILNNCQDTIRNREVKYVDWVDMEEEIRLYAKVTWQDPELEFPYVIFGKIISCGVEYPQVSLSQKAYGADFAEYETGPFHPREYAPNCTGGPFIFGISWGRVSRYKIYINETRFRIEDIVFADNLPIYSGTSNPEACYPFGSILKFGTRVEVMLDDWPNDCPPFDAKVIGYSDEIFPVIMSGTIQRDVFETSIAETNYQIGDNFTIESLNFDWGISVNDGPERVTWPGADQLKIYHGYRADAANFVGLSPREEVLVYDDISMTAKPYPFLQENDRILYKWIGQGVGEHEGNGIFQYIIPSVSKLNSFYPTNPGDYKIYYKIIDQGTGIEVILPEEHHKTIHIKPDLHVIMPVEGYKFKYNNNEQTGQAFLNFNADALPVDLNENIEWDFSEMGEEVRVFWSLGQPPVGKEGELTLTYLPISHSDFGEKILTASLSDYNTSVSVAVYLFFDKKAENAPPNNGQPNWYKYWKQGGPVPGMDQPRVAYDPSSSEFFGYYNYLYDWMCLGSDAADKYETYTIDDFEFTFEGVRGIDLTSTVVEHEAYHREIYNNWRGPDPNCPHLPVGIWYTPGREHYFFGGERNHPDDIDDDGLPNTLEESLSNEYGFFQLNPQVADTYWLQRMPGASPIYARIGDQELMARFFSEGARGIEELDWSAGEYSKQWP